MSPNVTFYERIFFIAAKCFVVYYLRHAVRVFMIITIVYKLKTVDSKKIGKAKILTNKSFLVVEMLTFENFMKDI